MDLFRKRRQSSVTSLTSSTSETAERYQTPEKPPSSSSQPDPRRGLFGSVKRSLSRASSSHIALLDDAASIAPSSNGSLHKSHTSVGSFDLGSRRSSAISLRQFGRLSRASTLSTQVSSWDIDWAAEVLQGHGQVEADPDAFRPRPTYLVVTQSYVVHLRSENDALAIFPSLERGRAHAGNKSLPDTLLVIPIDRVVSIFHAESSRPQFGLEIWWKPAYPDVHFEHTQLFFTQPNQRSQHLKLIAGNVKSRHKKSPGIFDVPLELEAQMLKVFKAEEPSHRACTLSMFAVVARSPGRDDGQSRASTAALRDRDTKSSWYLAVGRNLCYLFEFSRRSVMKYQAFGLVTLQHCRADWRRHEERVVMTFCYPFSTPIVLNLASHFYRSIVVTLLKADRFLKPNCPPVLQFMHVFRVKGIQDVLATPSTSAFGAFRRTLDAFLAAYRCPDVDWDINYIGPHAPQFRLIPLSGREAYSNEQLLAVLRALRFNKSFKSLSFRDVNLSGLLGKSDRSGTPQNTCMNGVGVILDDHYCKYVCRSDVLGQELHALAFCSQSVIQLDLTGCLSRGSPPGMRNSEESLFIGTLCRLIGTGLTRCNQLLLSGNILSIREVKEIVRACFGDCGSLTALDLSHCGLNDTLLLLIMEAIHHQGHSLQYIDLSHNPGSPPPILVAHSLATLRDPIKLNISGIIPGPTDGPVLSFELLTKWDNLQELDLSNCSLRTAAVHALEAFLDPSVLDNQDAVIHGGSLDRRSVLRKVKLNRCGLTGRQAAKLFRAMSCHPDAYLQLSGNDLEHGIHDLCQAITSTSGPDGLHIDMVEFRDEKRYISLIEALTINNHLRSLSLIGTAPAHSGGGTCSQEIVDTLERLIATHKCLRFLDLSGYSSKLDDGQLGQGVGRALRGLTTNTTLTHFRMRNQNLREDVGQIGQVLANLSKESALLMLDLQDNLWSISGIQFLVKSLAANETMIHFPLDPTEMDQIWQKLSVDLRRSSTYEGSESKTAFQFLVQQEQTLKSAPHRQLKSLCEILTRNQASLENRLSGSIDMSEMTEDGRWPTLEACTIATESSSLQTSPTTSQSSSQDDLTMNTTNRKSVATVRAPIPSTSTPLLQVRKRVIRPNDLERDNSMPDAYIVTEEDMQSVSFNDTGMSVTSPTTSNHSFTSSIVPSSTASVGESETMDGDGDTDDRATPTPATVNKTARMTQLRRNDSSVLFDVDSYFDGGAKGSGPP